MPFTIHKRYWDPDSSTLLVPGIVELRGYVEWLERELATARIQLAMRENPKPDTVAEAKAAQAKHEGRQPENPETIAVTWIASKPVPVKGKPEWTVSTLTPTVIKPEAEKRPTKPAPKKKPKEKPVKE